MHNTAPNVAARLHMLGLKCDDVPPDQVSSSIAALACFPMHMVANVHGWTTDRQFKVPVVDFHGLEAFREALTIGKKESRLPMTAEHRRVVDSMLAEVRPPDRVIYEYGLETLKQFLSTATPAVVERARVLVARMVVDVASASGKGVLGTGDKVNPQERECIAHFASELQLAETLKAAEILNDL
jgi:hypothetical protein